LNDDTHFSCSASFPTLKAVTFFFFLLPSAWVITMYGDLFFFLAGLGSTVTSSVIVMEISAFFACRRQRKEMGGVQGKPLHQK